MPSMEMLRLTSSGTEATMSAIRAARGFTGKDKIIKFEGCYHGHIDHLLVSAGSGASTFGEAFSKGVPNDFIKNTLIANFNDLKNKILGTHEFVHDIELDGMLHARVVRPPSVSSRIIKIDIDKINTLKNLKKLVVNGSFIAVIAEREEDAVKLVQQVNKYCKWSTPDKIIEDPLQFIRDTKSPIINSLDKGKIDVLRSDGVSTEVSRKFLCHASIGPCCAVAQWKGNTLEVYTHSQAVFAMKRTLASIFNIDESDVCLLYTSPSPRDRTRSRMPSSA